MMPHHWRPLAHEQNSIFKCKQHTCTLHGPWGPENWKYNKPTRIPLAEDLKALTAHLKTKQKSCLKHQEWLKNSGRKWVKWQKLKLYCLTKKIWWGRAIKITAVSGWNSTGKKHTGRVSALPVSIREKTSWLLTELNSGERTDGVSRYCSRVIWGDSWTFS